VLSLLKLLGVFNEVKLNSCRHVRSSATLYWQFLAYDVHRYRAQCCTYCVGLRLFSWQNYKQTSSWWTCSATF